MREVRMSEGCGCWCEDVGVRMMVRMRGARV